MESLHGEKDEVEKYLPSEEILNPKRAPIKNLRKQFDELVAVSTMSKHSSKKSEQNSSGQIIVPISFRDTKQFSNKYIRASVGHNNVAKSSEIKIKETK